MYIDKEPLVELYGSILKLQQNFHASHSVNLSLDLTKAVESVLAKTNEVFPISHSVTHLLVHVAARRLSLFLGAPVHHKSSHAGTDRRHANFCFEPQESHEAMYVSTKTNPDRSSSRAYASYDDDYSSRIYLISP